MKKLSLAGIVLVISTLAVLSGCEWWNQPTDPRLPGAVDQAKQTQEQLSTTVGNLKQAIEETKPEASTPDELDLLDRMEVALTKAENALADAGEQTDALKAELAQAETNGDLVLTVGGLVAGAFGVPYVPLITTLLKNSKAFVQLTRNIDQAEKIVAGDDETKVLDKAKLKKLNVAAGIEPKIEKARLP